MVEQIDVLGAERGIIKLLGAILDRVLNGRMDTFDPEPDSLDIEVSEGEEYHDAPIGGGWY